LNISEDRQFKCHVYFKGSGIIPKITGAITMRITITRSVSFEVAHFQARRVDTRTPVSALQA
jgi:hypothetical protein